MESPLGRQALRPGTAYWLPGLTPHDTRNEGQRPARMLEILLKRCDGPSEAAPRGISRGVHRAYGVRSIASTMRE
ncbi:MAG TPA: hypothetical protein VLF19_08000 [Methylomirabilota bacterium]|nr:hypothetical protein [Methylomirabilota bacterium]